MTATAVIEEIKHLSPSEQSRVIQFAAELAQKRQQSGKNHPLHPDELGGLAQRMVEVKDPTEAARLEDEIVRKFYGGEPHA